MSETQAHAAGSQARNQNIDVVRGLAILWVVLYHLYGFMTARYGWLPGRRHFYSQLGSEIHSGNPWHALTALGELIFAIGDDGVTVFLILSGASLTMLALRSRHDLDITQFYGRRMRRLLVPYWAGWAMFIATLFVLAIVRTWLHGGHFSHNFQYIGPYGQISMRQALDGLLIFPRGFSLVGFAAIPPSLWFVFVLLQYYLLFPLAYTLLQRIGPWAFAGSAFALSFVASYWFVWHYHFDVSQSYIWAQWWPFHPFDFGFGMALGYWLVRRPPWLDAICRHPVRVCAVAAGAIAVHAYGSTLLFTSEMRWVLAGVLPILGLGVVVMLVAAIQPGRLMQSPFARVLASVGVMSYAVLIVNDCMRLVNHYLVIQGYGYSAGWWVFITVVYVPGTITVAYPVARWLGLLPQRQRGEVTLDDAMPSARDTEIRPQPA